MNHKFYTPIQVGIGAFIGGPLAGCWLISANYRSMGDDRRGSRFLYLGIVSTALMMLMLGFMPEGETLDRLSFSCAVITVMFCFGYAKHIQAVTIKNLDNFPFQKQSYLRTFLISLMVLLFFIGVGALSTLFFRLT